jgi:hypothetical protein
MTNTTTTRKRRPMIEMTGTMADVLPGDYVDEIGDGVLYQRIQVSALLHKVHTGYGIARSGVVEVTSYEFLGKGKHGVRSDAPVKFRRFAD